MKQDEKENISQENTEEVFSFCFPPEKSSGISKKFFFMLFILLFAVLFHGMFFLLFRPLVNEKSLDNQGKGFTLLLTPEKVREAEKEYGLKYFLTYSDPARAEKIQKKHSFGAWERLSAHSPLSREILHRESKKLTPEPLQKKTQKNAPSSSLFPERSPAEISSDFPVSAFAYPEHFFPSGKEKKVSPEHFTMISKKDFPVWKFSTGELLKGLPVNIRGNARILQKMKDKVTSYTQYRILSSGKDLPPALILLRSCGVKELDKLAKRELNAYLGNHFHEEKTESRRFFYCTVFWSETLLFPAETKQMKGKTK